MAYLREGLQAYTLEYFNKKLRSPFALFRPFLYYLGLVSVEANTKLGRPNTPAVFGDTSGLGRGDLRKLARSTEHYFPFQKTEPAAPVDPAVGFREKTPVSGVFVEDNAGMAATKWSHFMEPIKIGKESLDDATGASAIMSIMDNGLNITWEALLKRINDRFLKGTMTEAQQKKNRWTDVLGLQHVLTNNNFYGQVDRSVETDLNPLIIAAGTDLDTTIVELGICDVINDGNATIKGRASRSADGAGCNLHIVHPKLFAPLRTEAQGIYQIHQNGIPGHAIAGHRKPIIEYGNNWITYDEGMTNSEWFGLRIESWMLEVDGRYNFVPQPFKLKSENEEGGEHYEWSLLHAKLRLTCREPWLQAKVTGLVDK